MLPHLALLQLLVQLFLQRDDVQARRGRAGHILHPQLPFLGPFPARWRALASKASPFALAPVRAGRNPHLGGKMELRMSSVCVSPGLPSTGGSAPCMCTRQRTQVCKAQFMRLCSVLKAHARLPPCVSRCQCLSDADDRAHATCPKLEGPDAPSCRSLSFPSLPCPLQS